MAFPPSGRTWLFLTTFLLVSCLSSCQTSPPCDPALCSAPRVCQAAECLCPSPFQTCGSACVSLQTHPDHCGACNKACPSGQVCFGGACGSFCPSPQISCDGRCVFTDRDPLHCGVCNQACSALETCVDGVCQCPSAFQACGSSCVDLRTNSEHCGACNNACTSGGACTDGLCVTSCPSSTPVLCLASCVDLQSNPQHCGACSNACNSGFLCIRGLCACPSHLALCQGQCLDLKTDRHNCGGCGKVCGDGQICAEGLCASSCPSPTATVCLGGCVDTQTNPLHCGGCGKTCIQGETCQDGRCTCPQGFDRCGTGSCLALSNTQEHCGRCNNPCAADQRCEEGACQLICAPGQLPCRGSCIDPQTDTKHCGGCDNACIGSNLCKNGVCECLNGATECGRLCVDTKVDPKHCGGCEKACPSGRGCQGGECELEVDTIAGTPPFRDGPALDARFYMFSDLAFDSQGNLYIADTENHRIRKLDTQGIVTTAAGDGSIRHQDGPAQKASFQSPRGLAFDSQGNLYIADTKNHRIRKLDTQGIVTTLAGDGTQGYKDGPAQKASFSNPSDVAVDTTGAVYITDTDNHRLRKLDTQGTVTTVAGGGAPAFADGKGLQAFFNRPSSLAFDKDGNLWIADTANHRLRKFDTLGNVTTVAGNGAASHKDGPALQASLHNPNGIAFDKLGNLFLVDTSNYRLRKLDTQGNLTTIAGTGTQGNKDGPALQAQFFYPQGIAVEPAGIAYATDAYNQSIRKLDTQGQVTTIAGGYPYGKKNGPALQSQFRFPSSLAFDSTGNLFILDSVNQYIRKLDTQGQITIFAGTDMLGYKDGPGLQAQFFLPQSFVADKAGNLYVADMFNYRIRKIDPQGNVTTVAGSGNFGINDGPALQAQFRGPKGLAFDNQGNLYITNESDHRIRKLDTLGNVTTFAGSQYAGYKEGPASQASFDSPDGLAVDSAGNVYVADSENHRIRKIDTQGIVTTLIGDGTSGYQDGPASQTKVAFPQKLLFDRFGNLIFADSSSRIRKWTPKGYVLTIVGNGLRGYKDGFAFQVMVNSPYGFAFDASGRLFFSDSGNHVIRRLR